MVLQINDVKKAFQSFVSYKTSEPVQYRTNVRICEHFPLAILSKDLTDLCCPIWWPLDTCDPRALEI